MDKARDFKFGVWIDHQAYKPENAKVGQKDRVLRHVSYFYNFCTPYYIYWTAELANFKFGAYTDHKGYYTKNAKIRSSGCVD